MQEIYLNIVNMTRFGRRSILKSSVMASVCKLICLVETREQFFTDAGSGLGDVGPGPQTTPTHSYRQRQAHKELSSQAQGGELASGGERPQRRQRH